MDTKQIPDPRLFFGPEARQQGAAAFFGKGGAIDPGAKFRQHHGLYGILGENMNVFWQLQPGVGGFGGVIVMVAGGDEHRGRNLSQAADQFFPRLVICIVTVQQVAGEQDKVRPFPPGQGCQRAQQFPLLPTADGRLAGAESLKGGVQVQVGAVEDPQFAHVSLIPSAFKHLPVSGSISKMQPSSLAGPLPDS